MEGLGKRPKDIPRLGTLEKDIEDYEMLELMLEDGDSNKFEAEFKIIELKTFSPQNTIKVMHFYPFMQDKVELKRWTGHQVYIVCIKDMQKEKDGKV
jgi:hypothetical protein